MDCDRSDDSAVMASDRRLRLLEERGHLRAQGKRNLGGPPGSIRWRAQARQPHCGHDSEAHIVLVSPRSGHFGFPKFQFQPKLFICSETAVTFYLSISCTRVRTTLIDSSIVESYQPTDRTDLASMRSSIASTCDVLAVCRDGTVPTAPGPSSG